MRRKSPGQVAILLGVLAITCSALLTAGVARAQWVCKAGQPSHPDLLGWCSKVGFTGPVQLRLWGFEGAPFYGLIDLVLINRKEDAFTGLAQISLFSDHTAMFEGLLFGRTRPLRTFRGLVQVAGLVQTEVMVGAAQVALFASAGQFFGLGQLGLTTDANSFRGGLQLGGWNSANDFAGALQLGLANFVDGKPRNDREHPGAPGKLRALGQFGLFNSARGDLYGFGQVGVVNVMNGYRAIGQFPAQVGAVNVALMATALVQLGLFNAIREDARTLQLGGLNYCKQDVLGAQIGLVNIARWVRGVQIGLLNISRSRWVPLFNFSDTPR